MHGCDGGRASQDAAVGARERLPVGRVDVRACGDWRTPRDAAVGARERLPVGPEHVRVCETCGSSRFGKLGDSERLLVLRETVLRLRCVFIDGTTIEFKSILHYESRITVRRSPTCPPAVRWRCPPPPHLTFGWGRGLVSRAALAQHPAQPWISGFCPY